MYSAATKVFKIRSCLAKERCISMTVNFSWLSTELGTHWLHCVNGYSSSGICHYIFYSTTFWAPCQISHLNKRLTPYVHTAQCGVMNINTRVTPVSSNVSVRSQLSAPMLCNLC
jgi:hypothetical protein